MPVASRLPPKNCPVCGERIWGPGDTMNVYQAWRLYNVHVHTNHPEYERWNQRMKMNYLFTIILAVVLPAIILLVTPLNVARLFVALIWGSALAVGAAIWAVQRKRTRRFRDSWNQEHGAPINPQ